MKTKLERIADKSAHEPKPEFTSMYHLINKELLMRCHRELDSSKAAGIDEVTKKEYGENLERNIEGRVERLKRKSYKPQPSLHISVCSETVNVVMRSHMRKSRAYGSVRGWHREVPVYSTKEIKNACQRISDIRLQRNYRAIL